MRENWAGHDGSGWPPQEWNARNSRCRETKHCGFSAWRKNSVAAVCAAARHADRFLCPEKRAHEFVFHLRRNFLRVESSGLQEFARFFHLINAGWLHFNVV